MTLDTFRICFQTGKHDEASEIDEKPFVVESGEFTRVGSFRMFPPKHVMYNRS